MSDVQPQLRRSLSLPLISLYGIGSILGAGIYVLIGRIAAVSGPAMPAAFLLASLIVAFSALTYAEMVARYPLAAGEAVYVGQTFASVVLFRATGISVILIGAFTAATLAAGFVGYLDLFTTTPHWLSIVLLIVALAALAIVGVSESVAVAALVTVLEIGGMLMVVGVAGHTVELSWESLTAMMPAADLFSWAGVVSGAFLAFYAFLGFEDMVTMAEEVRDAPRVLPWAIIVALVVTTTLYITVAVVAGSALPVDELAGSEAPFATIFVRHSSLPVWIMGLISIIAIVNGILIQVIKCARVLYGMASRGNAPRTFARVHAVTRTPVVATVAMAAVILLLALTLPVEALARLTSLLVSGVFILVNAALTTLKWRERRSGVAVAAGFRVPLVVPLLGVVSGAGFVFAQLLPLFT